MIGIYIPGMEMPSMCGECRFCVDGWCYVIPEFERQPGAINPAQVTNWCPLIAVPPHGRLIDADVLKEDLKQQCEQVFKIDAVNPDDFWITRDEAYNQRLWRTWCESFYEYIDSRPTVIPADKEGEA